MGGYTALYLGLSNPDLFSRIGGHSSSIWDYTSSDMFIGQRDWLYATDELRKQRDPFRIVHHKDIEGIHVYLDVGSEDGLAGVNENLKGTLESIDIPMEWHLNPGGHSMGYWTDHMEDYLLFYGGKDKSQ